MNHKKVVEQWYEISFGKSHRTLGPALDEFLSESPDLDPDEDLANEYWQDNHTVLRDYDGDFDGILIYHNDTTMPIIKFVCKKIDVNYDDIKGLNFKLIG